MAALKLYLILAAKDEPVQLSVHRDLMTIEETWRQCKQDETVGVIHIGFIRPKLRNPEDLLKHRGKILVSVAAKWAFPEAYQSSLAVVAELKLATQLIPLHQLLQGIGCDVAEPLQSFEVTSNSILTENRFTILEAAEKVLSGATRPLNKEEIFARIIENQLYQFGAQKPVSVLGIELNRYSRGTTYSNPASQPLFQKIGEDRYFSLEKELTELSGWVKMLADEDTKLAKAAGTCGVFSEESYANNADSMAPMLRDELDIYRFRWMSNSINTSDPQALINILPDSLMKADIRSIDLPIRVLNVLNIRGANCLSDLVGISTDDMLKWPNFGPKSVGDFCDGMSNAVDKLSQKLKASKHVVSSNDRPVVTSEDPNLGEAHQMELISSRPLKTHYKETLARLKDKDRKIMECRTGSNGPVMTLEAVGKAFEVTRERIRQIQKKYVERIIETEYWDDCIALKIGQLLIDRHGPLYIEMLEVEDDWFSGFMGNYAHLAAIIELFSENEIRVSKINGANIVTRIKADTWDQAVSNLRKSLKDKAAEGGWSREDIDMTFASILLANSASELLPLLWEQFEDTLQFDGDGAGAMLIGFGRSAEAAVSAVLSRAEKPLHYSEIADRATEIYGKEVSERLAHAASPKVGAKLYGPGIYGLQHHNPISERTCNNLRLIVSKMIQAGDIMKQWHCAEILTKLKEQFTSLPAELDHYILNIILEEVDNLTYLNRMVWARTDSGQSIDDRVDMADAFTKILEDNGAPLKSKELKGRLRSVRGVVENLQIQPSGNMIQVGPDYWGLIDRDIGGSELIHADKLNKLYSLLKDRQKGIHVSEVEGLIEVSDGSSELPSAYALLNLAQRDDRFHLGQSMFVGLAEWEGESRRLNISQAVRKLLTTMTEPMSTAEIHSRVEDLTEMTLGGTVTGILINEGAVYNQELKVWSAQ